MILGRGMFSYGDGMVISGGKHFDDGTAAFSGAGYIVCSTGLDIM